MAEEIETAIRVTQEALETNSDARWVIGFSGGKDSTALLKIFASASLSARRVPKQISIIYCDTGVENPILDLYVKSLLNELQIEFGTRSPFRIEILSAPVSHRFFVKVIGRGYPPPTNSFRWCTRYLRIDPVSRFIHAAASTNAIVALGMRKSESQQRNRSIDKNGGGIWQTQSASSRKYRLFVPLLELSVEDVWSCIFDLPYPEAIDNKKLATLYREASGECPIIRAPESAPCASGRFGCWTCTVVRQDKSSQTLISSGHKELEPFLEFRNWLSEIRNDRSRRWTRRRNGTPSPGPFTLAARREILAKLRLLERTTGAEILSDAELAEISRLWALDTDLDDETKFFAPA